MEELSDIWVQENVMATETSNRMFSRLDKAKNGEKFWVMKKSGRQKNVSSEDFN